MFDSKINLVHLRQVEAPSFDSLIKTVTLLSTNLLHCRPAITWVWTETVSENINTATANTTLYSLIIKHLNHWCDPVVRGLIDKTCNYRLNTINYFTVGPLETRDHVIKYYTYHTWGTVRDRSLSFANCRYYED